MLCRLVGAGKRYGLLGAWVVRDCSLDLRAGTIVEVAGPDGAGKSTLLGLISGSQEPTTGKVERAHTGGEYTPGHLPSGLLLSGETYLRNMATQAGWHREDANARVRVLTDGLGLGDVLRMPLASLPQWAAHRVALCRALAFPSEVIVLDDPWTGLDEPSASFLVGELQARRDAGSCVVVTDEGKRPEALQVDERYELKDGALVHTHGLA